MKKQVILCLALCLVLSVAMVCGCALADVLDVPAPSFKMIGSTTVERGEQVEIEMGEVPGVDQYQVFIFNQQEEQVNMYPRMKPGKFMVGTGMLAPGDYTVMGMGVTADGNTSPYTEYLPFTVTEYTGNADFVIHIGYPDGVYVNEFYPLSVYAPGAVQITLYDMAADASYPLDWEGLDAAIIDNEAGTHSFRVEAKYPDGSTKLTEEIQATILPSAE